MSDSQGTFAAPAAQALAAIVPAGGRKLIDSREQQLGAEVNVLRRELTRLQTAKRSADLELLESQRAISEVQQRLDRVKTTISYQLGSALVESKKSLRAMTRLPGSLLQVYRSSRKLRRRLGGKGDGGLGPTTDALDLVQHGVAHAKEAGGRAAVAWIKSQTTKPSVISYALIEIAKAVADTDPQFASALGTEAIELYPAEQRLKTLAFQLADYGHIRAAVVSLEKAHAAGANFNTVEARKADKLRAQARLLSAPIAIPERPRTALPAGHNRLAIIGREALPFHASTAALRLRDSAQIAQQAGWDACIITPPGYPRDIRAQSATMSGDVQAEHDGLKYLRLKRTEQAEEVADLYISAAAASFATAAVSIGARVMQADGAGAFGVAAALAARSAGCPLILDFGELYDPHQDMPTNLERTELGQLVLGQSVAAANAADLCIVRHPNIAGVLRAAGVAAERIVYVPYRFATEPPPPERIAKLARDLKLSDGDPVIGVVRDLCGSYDTGVLVDLLASLLPSVPKLKLLIVGQGRAADEVRKRAAANRVRASVLLVDKPDPTLMDEYRALIDVFVFTRHDTAGAALQSTFEVEAAMSAGRAIVAYRTADVRDVIEDGTTGLLSKPGDLGELSHKVLSLIQNAGEQHKMGDAARQALQRMAQNEQAHAAMSDLYRSVLGADRSIVDAGTRPSGI